MLNGADNDAVDGTVESDWTSSVNGPSYTQEALLFHAAAFPVGPAAWVCVRFPLR